MEEHGTIIKEVFGESSDSEGDESDDHQNQQFEFDDPDGERHPQLIFGESPSWEPVSEINGLFLCRDFLSYDQQSSLLSAIENEGWFTEASHNQAMRFGDLPQWATGLAKLIREVVHFSGQVSEFVDIAACDDHRDTCLLPSNLLWREPFFDQLIVNRYQPGHLCTC